MRRYRIDFLSGGTLTLTWAINNDVSSGTIGDGAQADAYDILHNLATQVSLTEVRLIGTYPVHGARELVVMRLEANQRLLHLLRAVGSDGLDPQSLWPLLRHTYVYPALEPGNTE